MLPFFVARLTLPGLMIRWAGYHTTPLELPS